jgi:protease-4
MMPPPGMMPPPWMMPPPPPRAGGLGKALLVTFMTTILACSLTLNFWVLAGKLIFSSASSSSLERTTQTTLHDGDVAQTVAVVRLENEITTASRDVFFEMLNKVEGNANVKALVVEVDSPGGAVTPSDEIYDRLRDLKAKKSIPVYVSMNSLAASGGYYVSMAADKVYAQETTLTGSIGVLFQRYDLSGLGEKYGIRDGTIVSDGATFKAAGSMMKPLSPTEETYFKSLLNDAFAVFKDRIAKGRPLMSKSQIDEAANGKIYTARQALELGLIDKIGYLDDVIADVATQAGLSNPNAVRYEPVLPGAIQMLLGGQAGASGEGAKLIAGGVKVNIDQSTINSLLRGRLVYLAPGF